MGEPNVGIALQMAVIFIGLPWTICGIWLVVRRALQSSSSKEKNGG